MLQGIWLLLARLKTFLWGDYRGGLDCLLSSGLKFQEECSLATAAEESMLNAVHMHLTLLWNQGHLRDAESVGNRLLQAKHTRYGKVIDESPCIAS